jgi:thiamine-monophosphate kinase
VADRGELALVAWLTRQAGTSGLLGDDAAWLPAPAPRVVTVDSQIEGVHFPPELDPADLARRLLAVNLSDLAAAGAVPRYAFLALATPTGYDHRRFFRALLVELRGLGALLAGGDLARQPERVTATLTLLGDPPPGAVPLDRRSAVAGHNLWLAGTLGESALGQRLVAQGARLARGRVDLPAGLALPRRLVAGARRAVRRHLRPVPQLALGQALALRPRNHRGAAMDVSDGLALDLHRLCRASGVGALLDGAALPRPAGFEALCQALGEDPQALALGGGEDYCLLFTLPPEEPPPVGFPAVPIGCITGRRRVELATGGRRQILLPTGWDHFSAG